MYKCCACGKKMEHEEQFCLECENKGYHHCELCGKPITESKYSIKVGELICKDHKEN